MSQQDNWWGADPVADHPAAAPASGPVYGAPPKAPDREPKTTYRPLTQDEVKARGLDPNTTYQISSEGKIDPIATPKDGNKPTEFQSKSASFYGRMLRAERAFNAVPEGSRDARTVPGQWLHEAAPNLDNSMNTSDRQNADAAALDFVRASLRQESGASINADEEVKQYRIFFPMPGDSPAVLKQKAEARRVAIEGFRIASGPEAEKIESVVNAGPPPGAADGEKKGDRKDEPTVGIGLGTDEGAGGPPPGETLIGHFRNQDGSLAPIYGKPGTGLPPGAVPLTADEQRQSAIDAQTAQIEGKPGLGDIAKNGLTLGLGDEAAGVGGAIGAAVTGHDPIAAYRHERDLARQRLAQARENTGWMGTATDLVAGGASLGVGGMMGPAAPRTIASLAKEGAGIGAVAGYGNGEGAQGSLLGMAGGAVIGGSLGAGGGKLSDILAARAARPAVVDPLAAKANALQQAGADEGITINRALVDPALQNRVTGVDSSLFAGPKLQAGMRDIEGQIEGGVEALGRGGSPMDRITAGDTYRSAAERSIKQTGAAAARRYDRAEQLAGDARVAPTESLRRVDDMISTLSETPTTNAKEIAFLQGLRSDLSSDLSVGALRRMRTSLRKKISTGDLVFGEDEGRVLSVMDAAADDIRNGLTAQGKAEAARAFDTADRAYRARMEYINGTLQKLIGKRNANLPAEQIADRVASMAKGKDAAGLRKFYATLTPDEQADAAATFAEQIGRNNHGDFSVAHFLSQTTDKKFPAEALRTIFGPRGAKSIENLRAIGTEVDRVTSAMNSRTSKTAVGNDYRSWLWNTILSGGGGAGLGVLSGGGAAGTTAAAVGTVAATAGVRATRDLLSARSLLSTDLTKWIASAPRNATPAMIAAHIRQLSKVAAADSAIAADARGLQDYLTQMLNQSPTRAAAGDQKQNGRRVPPR